MQRMKEMLGCAELIQPTRTGSIAGLPDMQSSGAVRGLHEAEKNEYLRMVA
jgi:hypothetical protein